MQILINIKHKKSSLSPHFNTQIQSAVPAGLWSERDTGSVLFYSFAHLLRFFFAIYILGVNAIKGTFVSSKVGSPQRDTMWHMAAGTSSPRERLGQQRRQKSPGKRLLRQRVCGSQETLVLSKPPMGLAQVNYFLIACPCFHWKTGERVELGKTRCTPRLLSWGRLSGTGLPSNWRTWTKGLCMWISLQWRK